MKVKKYKEGQLEDISDLVDRSENILQAEVVEDQKIEQLSTELDTVIASLGEYKRFFKRLS